MFKTSYKIAYLCIVSLCRENKKRQCWVLNLQLYYKEQTENRFRFNCLAFLIDMEKSFLSHFGFGYLAFKRWENISKEEEEEQPIVVSNKNELKESFQTVRKPYVLFTRSN